MHREEGQTRRHWAIAAGRAATIFACVLIAVAAQSVRAVADDPKPPPDTNKTGPVEEWVAEVGPEYVARQDALLQFVGWIHDNTAAEKQGFIAPWIYTEEFRIVLLWKGADAGLEQQIVDEGRKRSIDVEIERRKWNASDLRAIGDQLERSKSTLKDAGFSFQGIGGIREEPEIIVQGNYDQSADAQDKARIRDELESITGTSQIKIESADEGVNLGRQDDVRPFYAAAFFKESNAEERCSSGFAIRYNGTTVHTTTARHCDSNVFRSRNHFTSDLTKYKLGLTHAWANNGQARIMTAPGGLRMWDGPYDDGNFN